MTEAPRAYTADECREMLLDQIAATFRYWQYLPVAQLLENRRDSEVQARMEGLLHSLLVIFDGESVLPAFDIVPSPHPDDEKDARENGENWWPTGTAINECMLHEVFPWNSIKSPPPTTEGG